MLTNMRLTKREHIELTGMGHYLATVDAGQAQREFTRGIADIESGNPAGIYRALSGIEKVKSAFQRMHNYNHTVGMIAAKQFLEGEFPEIPWEEVEFAGGANMPGADICVVRPPVRIVGELKTTEPCAYANRATAKRFGSEQRIQVEKDLQKLSRPQYEGFNKYMFVTSGSAYFCLVQDYRHGFPAICFVLLSEASQVSRPLAAAES